ncbi:competence protein ComEC [Pseudoclavibacter endophyticus]|uniref:MBL fold metallo-hydrolase n=1 Tax=Pseudoclavibacter endophyticus TaxID=1778590 RepID=A0A6H9WAU5_9MICO|nr:ComEC/Rec2 family competence protein [Pseudoclavibacter endophyticus]KAB1646874.1 MBL fold metallo-hydrolase [Pseudoclavibacter endophyticus]GGA74794.1 competence protein ComEC [Pseudoclavibacter endophyticus]
MDRSGGGDGRVRSRGEASFAEEPRDDDGRRLDLRLLPAALTAWAVALVVALEPGAGWPVAIGCAIAAIALLAVIAWLRPRGHLRLALVLVQGAWCLALASLVACSGAVQWQASRGPVVEAALDHGSAVHVRAVVTGIVPDDALIAADDGTPRAGASRSAWTAAGGANGRFRASASALDLGDGWADVDVPLLVFGSVEAVATGSAHEAALRAPAIGAQIVFEARLREFEGGGKRLMALATDPAAQTAPAHPFLAWSDELRHRFVTAAQALPGAGGQLLPGLAVGDTRAVDDGLEAAMKSSSLTHLVAVSGSNCALVVGGIVLIGRLLGAPRGVRIAAASAALAAFVVIVTPEGSVVRAAAMAAIVLAVDGWGRHVRGAPVLCLAVILLLTASPDLGVDYGFALSIAATGGLLLGTRPLADRLERWMPRWLAVALAVPVAAQLACQPILILLQPVIPVYGVVANLLAAPAAPVATMVGLIGALLATLAPPLAPLALWAAWLPAHWIGVIATGTAGWPFATLPWPPGILGAFLLAVLTATAVVAWLVRPREPGGRRVSFVAGGLVIVTVAIIVGSGVGSALVRSATFPSEWRYAACDVGQGDAIAVRAGDFVALIDTGPDAEPLAACLDLLGVERIDVLVLSHFDHDHDGAAVHLVDRVAALVVPHTGEALTEPVVAQYATSGIPVRTAAAGDVWQLGDTTWRALWPAAAADGGPSPMSGNDGSLTVHVEPANGPSLLALGDLGEEPQSQVLRAARAAGDRSPAAPVPAVRADIVKMSHHGSSDQAAELYAATGAQLALVSVGAGNGYGHPTAAALGMLDAAGITAARTDLAGTIVVGGGGKAPFAVWMSGRAIDEAGTSEAQRIRYAASHPAGIWLRAFRRRRPPKRR